MIYFLRDWNDSKQKSSSGNFNIPSFFSFSEAPSEEESTSIRYIQRDHEEITFPDLVFNLLDFVSFYEKS